MPKGTSETSDEDPVRELAEGRTPRLAELRLHNGTIYRWNRPVYDVVEQHGVRRPHLRVENRVLPAGPTVLDMMANSAFYYGLLRTLAEEDRPLRACHEITAPGDGLPAAPQGPLNLLGAGMVGLPIGVHACLLARVHGARPR